MSRVHFETGILLISAREKLLSNNVCLSCSMKLGPELKLKCQCSLFPPIFPPDLVVCYCSCPHCGQSHLKRLSAFSSVVPSVTHPWRDCCVTCSRIKEASSWIRQWFNNDTMRQIGCRKLPSNCKGNNE